MQAVAEDVQKKGYKKEQNYTDPLQFILKTS